MGHVDFSGIVSSGVSNNPDPAIAVQEALQEINLVKTAFLLAFVPPGLALDQIGQSLVQKCGVVPVFGCTTAGQITPVGYDDNSLLLIAFSPKHFRCTPVLISPLKPVVIKETVEKIRQEAGNAHPLAGWNRFALVMADGLSQQEDNLVAAIGFALREMPVFGGSAGDGLSYRQTFILCDGRFHTNAALLLLIDTDVGFVGVGLNHFLPTKQQLVVTAAKPDDRIVCEINGAPAAMEYARLVGHDVADLSPAIFAENPLLVRNKAAYHVRAVQQVVDGTCLSFLSAIDDGLIMRIGEGTEIIQTLQSGLGVMDPAGNKPAFILGFDCILRKLEIEQKGLRKQVSQILADANVLGFCTYGEQHRGVHVNQTFVGVAFFPVSGKKHHD